MKLTHNDIVSARMWAETYSGEDNPLDVMAWKLLELVAKAAEENAAYHERSAAEARRLADEAASRFNVEGGDEFDVF